MSNFRLSTFAFRLAFLMGLAAIACAHEEGVRPAALAPEKGAAVAPKMRDAVERLLAALPEKSRAQAMRPFEDRDRTDWHYTPRSRNGIPLKDLDKASRDAVHGLLRIALSA